MQLGRRKSGFDESQLRSSNLSHYLGVIHAAENLPDVTQILQAFRCPGRVESLHVDVVAGQGRLWVKVIARKAQALHLIWAGNTICLCIHLLNETIQRARNVEATSMQRHDVASRLTRRCINAMRIDTEAYCILETSENTAWNIVRTEEQFICFGKLGSTNPVFD